MANISQEEADQLMTLIKKLENMEPIQFPKARESKELNTQSLDGRIQFIIDINRKGGRFKPKKCTYQTRYRRSIILLRIDLEGPPHQNPDGEIIPCPHIHIYKEGYNTRWAYPLSLQLKTDPTDLVSVLIDFLKYNNIHERPPIINQGDDLI